MIFPKSPADDLVPNKVELGNFPTRLVRYRDLGAELGIELWVKNEFEADSFGAGNKVRKIEYLIPELIRSGCTGVICDGMTQSNCAMALALYAPRFGLTVDLVLCGSQEPTGNYVDILRSGANVRLLPGWSTPEVEREREILLDFARSRGRNVVPIPTGATNETTIKAGVDLATELAEQEQLLGISFDFVVFPTATGGTHAGLLIGKAQLGRSWRLIPVGVSGNETHLSIAVETLVAAHDCRSSMSATGDFHIRAMGDGHSIPLPGTAEGLHRLRTKHGLILDSVYTYKAFEGMRQLIRDEEIPAGSSAVFIHTGGLNERFAMHNALGLPLLGE